MRRALVVGLSMALLGCAGPTQLVPTATAAAAPTPTATAAPTSTAPPVLTAIPTATATPTPTAGASLMFKVVVDHVLGPLTFLANAGDGTGLLYAVEQQGKIVIMDPKHSIPPPLPFLDITDRVSSGGERGLLGLAFHPSYRQNGRFYVDYTDRSGNTVVSEFMAAEEPTHGFGDGALRIPDPSSERVLFTVKQPFANHNGGMIAFGPEGKLYVGLGDGGSEGDPLRNGQNPNTLLSKIVRIDVDATGDAAKPTIWDSGLRNPWRFSFDRQTGDLWIGDVGQDAWEEIDAEPAGTGGRNYGWSIMEGNTCYRAPSCDQSGLTLPVVAYGHSDGNCAVIGGYVYRGSASPGLVGTYLYADLCSGTVWGLDASAALAGEGVVPVLLGNVGGGPTSFGEDEAGELYIVDGAGRITALT